MKPYDRLLTRARRRQSTVSGRSLDEEADSDRGRVIFCAPFRRLQNKAQVFSLEVNAAVRSRLTHSLEVSSIGRYIAQQAIKRVQEADPNDDLGLRDKERAAMTFVETACLLHDIGNPPFGHFGEIAIGDWFHTKRSKIFDGRDHLGGELSEKWNRHFSDFEQFDGNPQGFRIVTRLQPSFADDLFGLNLTATSLASLIKYPWSTSEYPQTNPSAGSRKKPGYFHTELDVAEWTRNTLGLTKGQRHPLVYLMEAADDIAYCISDIEDGIEKQLLSRRQLQEELRAELGSLLANPALDDIRKAIDAFEFKAGDKGVNGPRVLTPVPNLRASLIRVLVRSVAKAFANQQKAILAGEYVTLFSQSDERRVLDALKKFALKYLYNSPLVRYREITAHKVISGILDAYLPIMKCSIARFRSIKDGKAVDENGRKVTVECSLFQRIAPKYVEIYETAVRSAGISGSAANELEERVLRIRLILDQLSGMTDEFAMQTFQLISGMRIH